MVTKNKYLVAILIGLATSLSAQKINLQLRNTANTLEVWMVPQANLSGVVSSLTFAISWDAAYNVDLVASGSETVHVPAIPLQVSGNAAQTTLSNGTRKYRVYSSNGGATSISFTNNVAFKILSVTVPRTSTIPTGVFTLVDDPYTIANNFNYYFELSGVDVTGTTSTIATSVPIPVELIEFKAVAQQNDAVLTWKTANEQHFSHFDLERSLDGKTWKPIETVKSGRNTEGGYSHLDAGILAENNLVLYRLKMVDDDGSFKFSKMESVERAQKGKNNLRIYPNPTQNTLNWQAEISQDAPYQLDIIDASGKIWLRQNVQLTKGFQQNAIEISDLPSGVYWLKLMDKKGQNERLSFVKL